MVSCRGPTILALRTALRAQMERDGGEEAVRVTAWYRWIGETAQDVVVRVPRQALLSLAGLVEQLHSFSGGRALP